MDYKKYYKKRFLGHLISMPFIWGILPFMLALDLVAEIYHQVCFPLYGIKKFKRSEYIVVLDRNRLQYLNPFEKIGCMYCGYANGLVEYLKAIANRTEKYWCGVMHQAKPGLRIQAHQIEQNFSEFGNEEEFKKRYYN
ncbi:MAG: hypothetical protein JW816_00115 [Candidatus Buchananbacteria bacterium]|nr:hypothetical protein [Candidatus Buchananbacteria bacterium]